MLLWSVIHEANVNRGAVKFDIVVASHDVIYADKPISVCVNLSLSILQRNSILKIYLNLS